MELEGIKKLASSSAEKRRRMIEAKALLTPDYEAVLAAGPRLRELSPPAGSVGRRQPAVDEVDRRNPRGVSGL
jgi:hypothetical protein